MSRFRIQIEGTDDVIDCQSGQTLLHAALRAGIGFPHECSTGSCGTCQFQLVEGAIRNLWSDAPGLSERARRKGDRWLACQSIPQSNATIRVTTELRCRSVVRPDLELVTLAEVIDLTHDMREFVFKGSRPANFRPGQYVLLEAAAIQGARAYSMCNLPNVEGEWRLVIKRKPGGALTRYLFEQAVPGDMLTLAGPYGMAFLDPGMEEVVCISGGSGLSPMLSVLRSLNARESPPTAGQVQFFYGGRGPRDIVALPDDLQAFDMEYIPSVSDQLGENWTGQTGFIHEVAERRLSVGQSKHVFIAGPPPMVQATVEMLGRLGIERGNIHYDSFY